MLTRKCKVRWCFNRPLKYLLEWDVDDFKFIEGLVALRSPLLSRFAELDMLKVVDNSAYLLGEPIDVEDLCYVAERVKAHIVIAPDVLFCADATLKSTEHFLQLVKDKSFEVMGVVQGSSIRERCECARALLELGLRVIGVPYIQPSGSIEEKALWRRKIVEFIRSESDCHIHLLGLCAPTIELPYFEYIGGTVTIDTGLPYVNARHKVNRLEKLSHTTAVDLMDEQIAGWQKHIFDELVCKLKEGL